MSSLSSSAANLFFPSRESLLLGSVPTSEKCKKKSVEKEKNKTESRRKVEKPLENQIYVLKAQHHNYYCSKLIRKANNTLFLLLLPRHSRWNAISLRPFSSSHVSRWSVRCCCLQFASFSCSSSTATDDMTRRTFFSFCRCFFFCELTIPCRSFYSNKSSDNVSWKKSGRSDFN